MKKNHLFALTSVILTGLSLQAYATPHSSWVYHNDRYENKSFRITLPQKNQCIKIDNTSNPTRLEATTCNASDESWAVHRFQYVDGTIRTVSSGHNGKSWGGQRCLTATPNLDQVNLTSCNGSIEQQFNIIQFSHSEPDFRAAEDRFLIRTKADISSDCLTNNHWSPTTTGWTSCMNVLQSPDDSLYELVDVTEPVHVRLVNRGWYNMSFITTYNQEEWRPSWQALDGIRTRYLPTFSHTNISKSTLKINTDFGRSKDLSVEPGDFVEAVSNGTTFDKSMTAKIKSSTPQVKLYSGYNYASPKGSRYISDSVPNLMNFNDNIQSFQIPAGWSVRFFEEPNYQGRYYTRNTSSNHDSHVDMNIKSVKILHK